ncbi:hypothetical protein GOP47_0007511 [Adiantum capillus-veneris]|uniref:Pre-mRNA polyadenylation factor Fip1 domain-containing protein n=1 Tax=Adiantum capillus-veneris TaxID=13818 RepID=A0A9D4V1N9_ADICA|nr:hypothetical protein GOP47_0007511 [Adiantum capillus-veneris]
MDDDDFGELYGDQAVVGLSSGEAGSLHNSYSSYAIFDDDDIEDDKAYVTTPSVHTLPCPRSPPEGHVTQMTNSPVLVAELHEPDQLADRDSDEDDDLLLLGYNSKSGSSGRKVPADDTQGTGIDDPEEEFAKLTEISKTENVEENGGLVSLSSNPNRAAAVCVPGIMPTQELTSLPQSNYLSGHTVGPDVTNHTITIPGLSTTVSAPFFDMGDNGDVTEDAWEQQQVGKQRMRPEGGVAMDAADDWDTDSDDGLQIVLNEYPYHASGEKGASDRYEAGSEDEDDDNLIILERTEDGEDQLLQAPDTQAIQGDGAGEKQTGVEDNKGQQDKVLAGVPPPPQAPRAYGYHNYNSPYKYVRAGAAIVYNGSTGQTPGGRGGPLKLVNGRGDWRGPGRSTFGPHSTSQFSSWSTPSSFEFTLPPSMTVFEIDLDSFEEKPWRQSAVDISDFFNFGFDETTWKDYCKQLAQLRLESTMQSKIRVYESGRNEQDYDPDLPPELAVAAGLQEAGDKLQHRLLDTDSTATAPGRRIYMPMPLGRPIEVEGGLGDRRPSADSRKQRIRDSDSILLVDAVEIQNLETERLHEENVEAMDGEVDKDALEEEQQQDEDQEDEEEEQLVEEPKAAFKMRQEQHPWQKERMLRATSKPPAEERRDLELIRSQSATVHQDAESKPDGDTHEKDPRPLDKGEIESHKDAGDEIHDEERLNDKSAGQRIEDSTVVTSRERFSREVQAESSGCSSKRQRLVSPEGSHTASWDNGDGQKSARSAAYMKESRDSGESAMDVREDASRHRKKHRSYSEVSRGDQYRDLRQESESYHKKQVPSRHEVESEVHLHSDSFLESHKRPKQGLSEKVTSKDLLRHSKDRDDGRAKGREDETEKKGYLAREAVHHKDRAGSRSESKKRDDEDRETTHFRDKAGSRPESRRKEEGERRDRHDSRRRDSEDKRDRPEKDNQHRDVRDIQHRDKELEPLDWHNSDRRKKEDDYRRKDRPEDAAIKKDRERNAVGSDQHMRRKEEDSSKKERHEDRHKAKTRDGTLRDSEDQRQRNIDYQDSHGRAHKDDERAPHSGRSSRRHDEDRAERAWRGRDDSRMSDSTRSAEARSHSKDRRKGPDDYGKERSRLHDGRARSTADHEGLQVSESYDRDSSKHTRSSDDPRISGRGLHSDKHKLDSKRTKDFDREMSELATQSGDPTDTNKRKRSATEKNEGHRKKMDAALIAKTRDSQGIKAHPEETKELNQSKFSRPSSKARHFDAGDGGSSGEDELQRGRSKLERWMSHKDLEANMISERLSSQFAVKRDDKLRPGSRDKQHRDSSGLCDDLEEGNRHHAADRKSGKHSSSSEQANGKASKLKEKGDTLTHSKEVDLNADKKDFTDLPEHPQEDAAMPRTNMAAKLEKRKERFKVPVEDKDNVRKLDQEEHQQMEKDDSRQERPPRKRRWASG